MERSNRGERVLLGYNHQRLLETPSSSSETSSRDSDVDFRGVFGGPPPRREMRYSFNGAAAVSRDMVSYSSPWSRLSESPVFGEQTANRRRHTSDGFFDDIFRGGETYSSPRRSDRDPSCSSPGSRILSPARPLPTIGEPLGTSIPAQISFRARLTKAMGLHAFASGNHNQYKYEDGTSNGISSPYTPNASVSRFSSEAIQGEDESRKHFKPSYRQSPLSHVFSLRSEESSYMTKSEKTKLGGNLKENPKSMESPSSSSSQFNFSVNKWSCRGVPLLMPFRLRNGSKSKEKGKFERCFSYNERIGNDANNVSFKMDGENQTKRSTKYGVETCQVVEEVVLKKPELKALDTMPCTVENVLGCTLLREKGEETEPYSLPEISLSEETEKKISVVAQEALKPESKSLRTLLRDEIEEQDDEEITRKAEGKENVVKITKLPHSNVSSTKNVKKRDSKKCNPNRSEVDKGSVKGSPIINSGDNLGRSGLKGKVKEFVKIFNQEASSKSSPIQSSRCKGSSIYGVHYEANVNASRVDKKMQFPNVDENVELSEKQHSRIKSMFHNSIGNSSSQKNASSFSDSFSHGSNVTIDDPFREDYLIKELSHDQDKLPQTSEDYVPIQVSDAKIQQWSNGKKGNIRSLLSTLQYVLWAESGWKPMPLVDIIEGSAVKRAYQKALLCLHPDKLQQKGAASHQKYIAEKVFDILQEAWEHFNSLGSL